MKKKAPAAPKAAPKAKTEAPVVEEEAKLEQGEPAIDVPDVELPEVTNDEVTETVKQIKVKNAKGVEFLVTPAYLAKTPNLTRA